MGYSTDFVGHVDITPPLNNAETSYLAAFAKSRRWDRPEGPYFVPGNPYADDPPSNGVEAYNRTAPGQPQLWCQWVVCGQGDCLAYDGQEKFYAPVEWMRYLIEHFLSPTAEAKKVDDPAFRDFTFDHVLDGTIVGCRRDDRELFAIDVRKNWVTKRVMRAGDPPPWAGMARPYEEENDRWQRERARRRRNRNLLAAGGGGVVVDLNDRRGTEGMAAAEVRRE